MKRLILSIVLVVAFGGKYSFCQSYQYGLEISPSFDFQLQTASNNTWSTVSGNGFLLGVFFDKRLNEHTFLGTGAKFEYIGFIQKQGDFVVNSFQIGSLNIPLTFKQEIGITENWFYSAGVGLNYNFLNGQRVFGNWVNLNDIVNQWQPYVNVGINYLMDNHFEIGMHARYHFLDLWSQTYQITTQTKTKLFSFDFSIRYTLASH
ncbi:MAG: hypothetical protein R3279_10085 [Putridiphycobacter sp.]|nr:hypothetical protein [Putridiphycobacter sp.]